MTSLKDMAKDYVSPETKSIDEAGILPVDIEVNEKTFKEGTEDQFTILVCEWNEEEYRVPKSVIKQLKVLIEDDPEMVKFKVLKSGEGMNTSYTVTKA